MRVAVYESGYNKQVHISADDQIWTDEDCKKLKEDKIFYNKGVFAVMAQERKQGNPLLRVTIEDDGYISFDERDIRFDACFLDELISLLQTVKEDLN